MRKPLQRAPRNKAFRDGKEGRQHTLLFFCFAFATLLGHAQTITRHRLANGMEVCYVQDTTRRLLHLGLTLRGGATFNSNNQAGKANFFERHFWGTEDSSGRTHGGPFAEDGRITTSATYLEHHTFTLSIAPDSLAPGLATLSSALRTAGTRQPQRERILAELAAQLQAAEGTPFYYLDEGLLERFWPDAARHNAIGTYSPLLDIGEKDMLDLAAHYLYPSNCLLSGTGPDSSEVFFQAADSLLADWQPRSSGAGLARLKPGGNMRDDYFIIENEYAHRPLLLLAWPVPGGLEDDNRTARLAAQFTALARLRGGPFHQALTATGRADALWWEYVPTLNPGCLVLRVAPHPDSVRQCLQAIQDQLYRMSRPEWKSGGLLETANRMLTLEEAIAWDRSAARLDHLGESWLQAGNSDSAATAPGLKALKAFVAEYLAGQPHVAGLLADSRLATTLRPDFHTVDPAVVVAPPVKPLPTDNPPVIAPPVVSSMSDTTDYAAEMAAAELLKDMSYLHDIRIYFYGNTMDLDSSTTSQLSDVAFVLRKYPQLKLYVNGYADGVGDGYFNYKLSIQRARTVRDRLVAQYKLPEDRLILQPFGEAFAEYPDDTPDHRRKNRRVTFEKAPADAQPRYFID
jgi:outer membrane protein OmpA-like peptidoglycan-associated protein/predicted Zn-dependent peptidase